MNPEPAFWEVPSRHSLALIVRPVGEPVAARSLYGIVPLSAAASLAYLPRDLISRGLVRVLRARGRGGVNGV